MAHRGSFAEQPVRVSKLPSFRAEHFPYAGPYPWLDRDDAEAEIARRTESAAITKAEAERCRYWANNGYVILPSLFDDATLDEVWEAYERAIAAGRIVLPEESAGSDDPHPGRYLNPH